jgi:hypothetical protein
MSETMAFNNGLSPDEDNEIDDIMIELQRIKGRIGKLEHHRSYSLAFTKVEEAFHWMRDRKHKPA